MSSDSSHHPQDVILAQSSLYVQKGGLKPHLLIFVLYCLALRCFSLPCFVLFYLAFPASTNRLPNTVIMLAHCLRRWPSIRLASSQRLVFPGLPCIDVIVLTRWLHVVDKPWAGHGWKIRHHWIVCCYHYLQQ